jgi:hypothetical protein
LKLVRIELSDLEHVTGGELRLALGHWLDLRREKLLPAKCDIDPGAIPTVLPHLAMYQHTPEDGDYICHLVGEEIYSRDGHDLRGRRLSQGFPNHQPLAGLFDLSLERRGIIYGTGSFSFAGVPTPAKSLVLPFTGDAGAGYVVHVFIRQTSEQASIADVPDEVDILNTLTPAYAEAGTDKIVSIEKRIRRDSGGRMLSYATGR